MTVLRIIPVVANAAALLAGGAFPAAGAETGNEGEKDKPADVSARTVRPATSPEGLRIMKEAVEAMKSRDWNRAESSWEKLVELEPGNAGARANLGKVQLQLKETTAAIASLEKAVSLQPALADAWMALGMAYNAEKASMRAVSCLTRAVHENPADARTRNSLAIVLKTVGWTGAAESELQKALDLDPRYAEAHFNLAVMYLERRPPSLEMARRHYESARELGADPDKEMEAELAGKEPAIDEAPPPSGRKLPAVTKPQAQPKPTRPK